MKKIKSIISLVLVLLLAVSIFTSCNSSTSSKSVDDTNSENQNSTGKTSSDSSDNKLVITATLEGNIDAKDSIVEEEFQKLMSEKLGREIEIKYNMIPGGDYGEKAQLLIAANDITDYFQLPFLYDYSAAASEGMFLDLYEHKDKLPQYFELIEQTKDGVAGIMTPTGNVYVLAGIGLPQFPEDRGMLPENVTTYRYDLFEKHNIPIPTTLDELYEAAKELKKLYPDVYPVNTRWKKLDPLFYANHTVNSVYWNGEEYVMGLFEEGYKEALQFANKLYEEGLLDPEYLLETDDTLKSKELNDQTFIVLADWFTTPGEFTRLSETGQIFAATLWPDNPKYGKAWQCIQRVNEVSRNVFYSAVISSKVEDVDGILEFINRSLDDDAVRLLNWGIEGETYTVDENGNLQFVDEIMNADDPWIAADKWGMRASRNKRPGLGIIDDSTAFVALAPNDYLYYEGELHIEPFEKSPYYLSFPYPDNEYIPPMFNEPILQFTTEESQERSQMMTLLETYRDEMEAKFVSGEESFDNWDDYMQNIRDMVDVDRLLEIHNNAAQRYFSNK